MKKEKTMKQTVTGITKEILMLQDICEISIAHILAYNSGKTGWTTEDKEILLLQDKEEISVAHELAYSHPTWTTSDPELLSLMNKWGNTVEDALITRERI